MSTPPPASASATFDAWYYEHSCGRPYARDEAWLKFFGEIAARITGDILAPSSGTTPRRVLDAGCAIGLLVEALHSRGVDAEGLDVSDYAISQVPDIVGPKCRVASLTTELPGRYDLIVCIEVLEHMPAADARLALSNICRHADDVLFSSSSHDFAEATHVNVQPPEVWAELFARDGFLRDLDYDASYITPWAARFRRRSDALPRIVLEYERVTARLLLERNERRLVDRHIQEEAAEAPGLRAALHAAEQRLATLEDTIHHMERSLFWRVRGLWRSVVELVRPSR